MVKEFCIVLALFLTSVAFNISAECLSNYQKQMGIRAQTSCRQERMDTRCNQNSDCCPGKQCNSFGFCELCRD